MDLYIISVVVRKIETIYKVTYSWIKKSEAMEQTEMMSTARLVGEIVKVTAPLLVSLEFLE
jgi:hypothetical protein